MSRATRLNPAARAADLGSMYPVTKLGVYMPAGWGRFWRPARAAAKAGQGLANISVYGDSIGHSFASDLDEKTYPGRIQAALAPKYGDGGGGYFGVGYMQGQLTFTGSAWITDDNKFVRKAGTWANGTNDGPGQRNVYSVTDGSTLTKRVRGTTVGVWVAVQPGAGTISCTIDGGSPITVDTSDTYVGFRKVTLATGLTAGYHMIVVTKTGSTRADFNGFWGENATGVIVNNYSAYGALSQNIAGGGFGSVSNYGRPVPNCGGYYNPSHCFVYAMGANDANAGATDPDSYAQNVYTALQQVRQSPPAAMPSGMTSINGATDIILFQPHLGNFDGSSRGYQYTQRMRGLAEAFGAAVVTAAPVWRNTWSYAQAQGIWGTTLGSTPGGSGSDSVHISDVGCQAYADLLLTVLDS